MPLTFTPRPVIAPDERSSFDHGLRAPQDDAGVEEPLVLPAPWQRPPRQPLPLAASTAPVIGAVVIWAVTGSVLALMLAALGPLIAVAGVWDARRAVRRERGRHAAESARRRAEVAHEVARRHEFERQRRWARQPDVAGFLARDDAVWRSGDDGVPRLVIGAGTVASLVRVTGGEGDAESAKLRADSARLTNAPITVPVTTGVAVVGNGALADAVHRALVLQACLSAPPGRLRIVGDVAPSMDWIDRLPHRSASSGLVLAALAHGEAAHAADAVIARVAPGGAVPPACGAVLSVVSPDRAHLELGGEITELAVEAVGRAQALAVAESLTARAAATLGLSVASDDPVMLSALLREGSAQPRGSLSAVIGRAGARPTSVDLVSDGPHAVVAGVTGSGKSELLISWVLSLAATRSTAEVNFLLADFKGGTAFDALAGLPHVTGVLTDLDGGGARRAIESLRAEVRWREAELARVGAREVADPRADFPRLVVVVDEFAALVAEHPELSAVFVDVAARGRALGLHLILGTQRVAGVLRENLLSNCPLRISLRVTDPADSRAVVGSADAAELPGGVAGRGLAIVRRGGDAVGARTRVALSRPDDVARITSAASSGPPVRRPWLPALPRRISVAEVAAMDPERDGLILGLADEPELQRQRAVRLRQGDRGVVVVGGPGSGRTTTLETLAAQRPAEVVMVPPRAEEAWDAVAALSEASLRAGTLVIIDDLDAILGVFPPEHAQEFASRLERLMRSAGESGLLFAVSLQRLTGAAARLAELLPLRLTLPTATRADHLAAGGDAGTYAPDAPPGRGRLRGVALQVAVAEAAAVRAVSPPPVWSPTGLLTGIVTRRAAALSPAREQWTGVRWYTLDEYAADAAGIAEQPVVIVGDPDDWQRHWRLLAAVRSDHDLVIDTSCAAEYRVLAATREVPPYAAGPGRAWLLRGGADIVRIVLPAARVESGPAGSGLGRVDAGN